MFILFGTKGRAIETDSGQFHCPNCNIKEEYGKKYVQDWFTLFFIPIFPVGEKKNRHVECQECSSTYYPSVLEGNKFNIDGTIFDNEEKAKANA